jgi:hypothetical protein
LLPCGKTRELGICPRLVVFSLVQKFPLTTHLEGAGPSTGWRAAERDRNSSKAGGQKVKIFGAGERHRFSCMNQISDIPSDRPPEARETLSRDIHRQLMYPLSTARGTGASFTKDRAYAPLCSTSWTTTAYAGDAARRTQQLGQGIPVRSSKSPP